MAAPAVRASPCVHAHICMCMLYVCPRVVGVSLLLSHLTSLSGPLFLHAGEIGLLQKLNGVIN